MTKIWIITATIFILLSVLVIRVSINYYRKEYRDRMWKSWGMMAVYYEGVIILSGLLTSTIVYLLVRFGILEI